VTSELLWRLCHLKLPSRCQFVNKICDSTESVKIYRDGWLGFYTYRYWAVGAVMHKVLVREKCEFDIEFGNSPWPWREDLPSTEGLWLGRLGWWLNNIRWKVYSATHITCGKNSLHSLQCNHSIDFKGFTSALHGWLPWCSKGPFSTSHQRLGPSGISHHILFTVLLILIIYRLLWVTNEPHLV